MRALVCEHFQLPREANCQPSSVTAVMYTLALQAAESTSGARRTGHTQRDAMQRHHGGSRCVCACVSVTVTVLMFLFFLSLTVLGRLPRGTDICDCANNGFLTARRPTSDGERNTRRRHTDRRRPSATPTVKPYGDT